MKKHQDLMSVLCFKEYRGAFSWSLAQFISRQMPAMFFAKAHSWAWAHTLVLGTTKLGTGLPTEKFVWNKADSSGCQIFTKIFPAAEIFGWSTEDFGSDDAPELISIYLVLVIGCQSKQSMAWAA